jgi:iron(III) transport system ATP-binding protein
MSRARISQIGTPRELYDAPGNAFIADFIGDSNLIKGELRSGVGGRFFVAQNLRVSVPDDAKLSDGAVCMSVRPQKWRIQAEGACVGDDWICVPGVLGKGAYLGSHMEWLVQTEHGELLVIDDDTRTQQSLDSAVLVCVAKSDVRWVVAG